MTHFLPLIAFSTTLNSSNGAPIDIWQDTPRSPEFANFAAIRDNYPKWVISRDKIPLSQNGIIHRNIIDFLLDR